MKFIRLIIVCALLSAMLACSNNVSGRVYFDANQDGEPDELLGLSGVPVELYLVSSASSSSTKRAPVNNTVVNGKAALSKSAESDESDIEDVVDGDAGEETTPVQTNAAILFSTFVPIEAPSASGSLVEMTTTDKEGNFHFDLDEAGEYEVRVADDYGPLTQGYQITSGKNPQQVDASFRGAHLEIGMFRQGLNVIGGECPEQIHFGETPVCEIMYRNDGPVPMHNVTIAAKLPFGIDAVPMHDGSVLTVSNEVVWHFEQIHRGAVVPVGFVVQPQSQYVEQRDLEFAWSIRGAGLDAEGLALGSTSAKLSVQPALYTKMHAPQQRSAGQKLPYEVVFGNAGGLSIAHATLVVKLPDFVTQVNSTGFFDPATHELRWPIGKLPVGDSGSRYFSYMLPEQIAQDQEVSVSARLEGSGIQEEHVAQEAATTLLTSNMAIDFTVTPDQSVVHVDADGDSDEVTWTIQLENNGQFALTNVVFIFRWPEGLEQLHASNNGQKVMSDRAIVWQLGKIQPGASVIRTVRAQPSAYYDHGTYGLPVTVDFAAYGMGTITKSADIEAVD